MRPRNQSSTSRRMSPNQGRAPLTYEVGGDYRPKLGGMDVLDLAKTYGTPLYVMDAATIRATAAAYRDTLAQEYPGEAVVLYASKANLSMGLCKLMEQEGLGLDVVSAGELYTAIQAGFPMDKVLFNGNNKTSEELEMAIHHKVGRISVDNFYEMELIHQIAEKKKVKVAVLLRMTPGIECHTHDYIKTGQTDTKFGFDMGQLSRAIDLIVKDYTDTMELKGLHAHIGSQIFEVQPYEDLVQILLNICFNIRQAYDGLTLDELNLGGGMGIQYTKEDDPPKIQSSITRIVNKLKFYAEQIRYPMPKIYMEPGRSMVGTSGITLYEVGSMKVIPRVKKYVAVNGGMGDNIRPALYQAKYTAVIANKLNEAPSETVTVVGKYCESGDVLIPQIVLPKVESGDILMVFGTGAYNYSMSSNYNRIPRPATILVENGHSHILVKRETYQTVVQQDLIPPYLMEPKPVELEDVLEKAEIAVIEPAKPEAKKASEKAEEPPEAEVKPLEAKAEPKKVKRLDPLIDDAAYGVGDVSSALANVPKTQKKEPVKKEATSSPGTQLNELPANIAPVPLSQLDNIDPDDYLDQLDYQLQQQSR